MRILHLHWLTPIQPGQDGRLLLWAETAVTDQPSRDRRKKTAQPHPFVTSPQELHQLLKAIGWAGKLPTETLALWLPTNCFGPIPSPDLMHNWETDDAPPELLLWTVTGLGLGSVHALALLTYLHQHDLPPAVFLGQDGRYWQTTFSCFLGNFTVLHWWKCVTNETYILKPAGSPCWMATRRRSEQPD